MTYLLPHLHSGWAVDQAIVQEKDKVVLIRFGEDHTSEAMRQDEVLFKIADKVSKFVVIYLVDTTEVKDFNGMYELVECCLMFFYRNKLIQVDTSTGNNHKIEFIIEDKQDLIDICEAVYRAAVKGKGLAVSPRDFSTKSLY